jgi:hypothetical protein
MMIIASAITFFMLNNFDWLIREAHNLTFRLLKPHQLTLQDLEPLALDLYVVGVFIVRVPLGVVVALVEVVMF